MPTPNFTRTVKYSLVAVFTVALAILPLLAVFSARAANDADDSARSTPARQRPANGVVQVGKATSGKTAPPQTNGRKPSPRGAAVPPVVVYVDDDWTGTTAGADPDGAGPATSFGTDAFATIQGGIDGVAANGTVNVYAGTYDEDVNVNKSLSLLGAGAADTNIRGPIGGAGATVQIVASGVTVAGFTVTRLGNNTTDWNNPGLNSTGFAIQGQAITGAVIRDNTITGNRTGIDINNSNGHTVRNNSIDFNRTGLIYRNQTDSQTAVENFITNNWTVGVLFLDASGGSNSPVQTALNSTFSNNNISGNWYAQVVDRQTGGSLPAPNTTNLKNFRGNWWGTASPVVTTANSAEPGYAAQIPTAYGGTATPPGGQPDIAGPASANVKYLPLLTSGMDTNVETTPGRGTNGFQGAQAALLVWPPNQQSWVTQTSGTSTVSFVQGPATPPLGTGSGQFSVGADGSGAAQFRQTLFNGTLLSELTELSYSTYTSNDGSAPMTGDQTVYIILNVDFDGNGTQDTQLFFEPEYQHGYTNAVPDQGDNVLNTWQTWDALQGGWWSTTGVAGANPGSAVKPLSAIIAAQPGARILNSTTTGSLRLVAGFGAGSWDNFVGNVDNVRVGVGAFETTYDFDPLPGLSVGDVSLAEGDAGTTAFNFNITLARAVDAAVTVDYSTADGTAADGSDYTGVTTTQVTFNPGETSKQVTVQVNGDTTVETNENFFVNLSNPSNATLLDGQGEGTIQNDDVATFSIDDVTLAEGNSGTTAFIFTVTKTGGVAGSVDFNTQDNEATTADGDYQTNTGALVFAAAETTKQITVLVNGDTTGELDETFSVVLSNPSGATISDGTGTGTIRNDDESVNAGQLIISEFRLRGPGASPTVESRSAAKSPQSSAAPAQASKSSAAPAPCGASMTNAPGGKSKTRISVLSAPSGAEPDTSPEANDEFIELYNNSDSPLLVTTTDDSEGWAVAASDGLVRFIIPVGTVIPPRAHFLSPNLLGYSLSGYPAGDGSLGPPLALGDFVIRGDGTTCFGYELDIPDNAGIALFRTSNTANFSTTTRLDAAGSTAEANELYREGAGYPALAPADIAQNLEHTFYRSLCAFVGGTGCSTPGLPKDSGDNASDFHFVDTQGTQTAAGRRIGAPGPENLASPVQRNDQFSLVPLDRTVALSAMPNRERDFTSDPANNSAFGTLTLRRRVTNNTGEPVTALRFRIVELTTYPSPAGTADLRTRDAAAVVVTGVTDEETCSSSGAGAAPCAVNVLGTTLEQPPSQPQGGGFNSSLGVNTITFDEPLAPGASVNVQFLLGIQQTGTFRFLLNIEAVTDNCSCPALTAPRIVPPR